MWAIQTGIFHLDKQENQQRQSSAENYLYNLSILCSNSRSTRNICKIAWSDGISTAAAEKKRVISMYLGFGVSIFVWNALFQIVTRSNKKPEECQWALKHSVWWPLID